MWLSSKPCEKSEKRIAFILQRDTEAQRQKKTGPRALPWVWGRTDRVLTLCPTLKPRDLPETVKHLAGFPASLLPSPKPQRTQITSGQNFPFLRLTGPLLLRVQALSWGSAGSDTTASWGGLRDLVARLPHIWGSERAENQGLRNHWRKKLGWKTKSQGPTWRGSGVESRQKGDRKNDFFKAKELGKLLNQPGRGPIITQISCTWCRGKSESLTKLPWFSLE